ncbi:MAG: TIGR02300 family protein [Paracoccaceae bacterium]
MPKEEWGVKRICPTTGRRFYDLNKTPIVSPYTGETVTLDANTRTRVAVVEKPKKKEEKPAAEEESTDLLDATDDGNADLNDDLLDDDDDDKVTLDEIADAASDEKES